MGDRSKIEWTDATWQVTAGCTAVSPGCANCYAARMTRRLEAMGHAAYSGLTDDRHFNGTVRTLPENLLVPLKWKRPRRIFVDSMSDLFHPNVPNEFIAKVFATMYECQWHTFQVLTKRPQRLLLLNHRWTPDMIAHYAHDRLSAEKREYVTIGDIERDIRASWPLRNVWLGTSVENQAAADARRDHLSAMARAGWLTWVSSEPRLGPVDWSGWEFARWMVSGGESGPGARPADPRWFRADRDWCAQKGVPFLFKQWGEWIGGRFDRRKGKMICQATEPGESCGKIFRTNPGMPQVRLWDDQDHYWKVASARVGKKRAGRLLDGRECNEFPDAMEGVLAP